MKKLFFALIVMVLIASCGQENSVNPPPDNNDSTAVNLSPYVGTYVGTYSVAWLKPMTPIKDTITVIQLDSVTLYVYSKRFAVGGNTNRLYSVNPTFTTPIVACGTVNYTAGEYATNSFFESSGTFSTGGVNLTVKMSGIYFSANPLYNNFTFYGGSSINCSGVFIKQ